MRVTITKVPNNTNIFEEGGVASDNQEYTPAETALYKSGGIYIKPSKRGTFTAAATKHGKSVQSFASHVLAHKDKYSPLMVKKANFAKNASKWKHEFGGMLIPPYFDGTAPFITQQEYGGEISEINRMEDGGELNGVGYLNTLYDGGGTFSPSTWGYLNEGIQKYNENFEPQIYSNPQIISGKPSENIPKLIRIKPTERQEMLQKYKFNPTVPSGEAIGELPDNTLNFSPKPSSPSWESMAEGFYNDMTAFNKRGTPIPAVEFAGSIDDPSKKMKGINPLDAINNLSSNSNKGKYKPGYGMPLAGYGIQALSNLPALFAKADKVRYDRITPQLTDLSAQRDEARRNRDLQIAMSQRNASMVDNTGQLMAATNAGVSNAMGTYGNTFNKSLMDQYATNAEILNRVRAQNAELSMKEAEGNADRQAAVKNAKMQAIMNMGQAAAAAGDTMQKMKQQGDMLAAMGVASPDYGFNYTGTGNKFLDFLLGSQIDPYRKRPEGKKYGGKIRRTK